MAFVCGASRPRASRRTPGSSIRRGTARRALAPLIRASGSAGRTSGQSAECRCRRTSPSRRCRDSAPRTSTRSTRSPPWTANFPRRRARRSRTSWAHIRARLRSAGSASGRATAPSGAPLTRRCTRTTLRHRRSSATGPMRRHRTSCFARYRGSEPRRGATSSSAERLMPPARSSQLAGMTRRTCGGPRTAPGSS